MEQESEERPGVLSSQKFFQRNGDFVRKEDVLCPHPPKSPLCHTWNLCPLMWSLVTRPNTSSPPPWRKDSNFFVPIPCHPCVLFLLQNPLVLPFKWPSVTSPKGRAESPHGGRSQREESWNRKPMAIVRLTPQVPRKDRSTTEGCSTFLSERQLPQARCRKLTSISPSVSQAFFPGPLSHSEAFCTLHIHPVLPLGLRNLSQWLAQLLLPFHAFYRIRSDWERE